MCNLFFNMILVYVVNIREKREIKLCHLPAFKIKGACVCFLLFYNHIFAVFQFEGQEDINIIYIFVSDKKSPNISIFFWFLKEVLIFLFHHYRSWSLSIHSSSASPHIWTGLESWYGTYSLYSNW